MCHRAKQTFPSGFESRRNPPHSGDFSFIDDEILPQIARAGFRQ
jgi:hypothetical protein